MGPQLVTAPAKEPVTLDEARAWLRKGSDNSEDSLIQRCIRRARTLYEERSQRQLITATWRLTLDAFPGACEPNDWVTTCHIRAPRSPLQSVTSITYADEDGDTQTLDDDVYVVDTADAHGRIGLAYGETWPTTLYQDNAIVVTCVCGYGDDPSDVPDWIKAELEFQVGWLMARGVDSGGRDRDSLTVPQYAEFGAVY